MTFGTGAPASSRQSPALDSGALGAVVTQYGMVVHVMPTDHTIDVAASLTIRNTGTAAVAELPFLLYRLLAVNAVTSADGRPVAFTQRQEAFAEEPKLVVNALSVNLPRSLAPGDTTELRIRYRGSIEGYPDVMAYTKDHIGEDYSLLRQDVFAYPVLARPSFASWTATIDDRFDYDVQVIVPTGYVAAGPGVLVARTVVGDSLRFEYRSRVPVYRLGVAVAHFAVRRDTAAGVAVYCLTADTVGADTVLAAVKRASALYTKWFGPPPGPRPGGGEGGAYTVIEMPEGYGSEATPGYLLQAAAAFRNPGAVAEVYHEVGHSWNARASPSVQRDRWFDEAFASYFAALAVGAFDGPAARDSEMARARSKFLAAVAHDSLNATVPIAEYGAHNLGDDSYTKGAWSLYVLNRTMGDNAFRVALRDLFAAYGDRPVDYHSFQVIGERAAGRSLNEWFRAWIYGAESSRWLEQGLTVDEMASRSGGTR